MDETQTPLGSNDNDKSVSWTASEFIAHEKSVAWYIGLAAASLIIAALIFLITRDFISVGVVIVAAVLLGIYGAHQPRQLEYAVDARGISIGSKHYGYDEFRSFSVIPEGAFSSIVFMPLKRFAVQTAMHYPPEEEERIIEILGERLPLEAPRRDHVDSLMRRIRF